MGAADLYRLHRRDGADPRTPARRAIDSRTARLLGALDRAPHWTGQGCDRSGPSDNWGGGRGGYPGGSTGDPGGGHHLLALAGVGPRVQGSVALGQAQSETPPRVTGGRRLRDGFARNLLEFQPGTDLRGDRRRPNIPGQRTKPCADSRVLSASPARRRSTLSDLAELWLLPQSSSEGGCRPLHGTRRGLDHVPDRAAGG